MFLACHLTYFLACHLTSYFLKPYELPHEVTLRDISYACCAGLLKYSDRAYVVLGCTVQSTARLEENRRKD